MLFPNADPIQTIPSGLSHDLEHAKTPVFEDRSRSKGHSPIHRPIVRIERSPRWLAIFAEIMWQEDDRNSQSIL
jgi:hypothetical protein